MTELNYTGPACMLSRRMSQTWQLTKLTDELEVAQNIWDLSLARLGDF